MIVVKSNAPFRAFLMAVFFAAVLSAHAAGQDIAAALAELPARIAAAPPHPRLLMNQDIVATLRERIQSDDTSKALFALIRERADKVLGKEPVTYHKDGKRLLSVSREVLKRVLDTAMVYRLTDAPEYAARAVKEMEAVAAFSDWNPSHFLDVAEMTTALAIGYDWLLPTFSAAQEETIRNAILEKGIAPSFEGTRGWLVGDNNWNQVCNCGMILGALALAERDPALAEKTIARSVEGLPYAMRTYEPDGVYVEGPTYWEYGTTFNVLAIAALESALGTSFGLDAYAGFQRSAAFPLLVTGPTGLTFNFADCGQHTGMTPALYWFAHRWNDTGILWCEQRALQRTLAKEEEAGSRFLPFVLVWRDGAAVPEPRQPLHWKGESTNPIAIHRSSWTDPDAVFLAIKGGTPRSNHGHMDAGSFILDADGARWALDFGSQGYGELEARGLDIWNRNQHSDRWRVYRYNNSAHNTLVVDGAEQKVTASAAIAGFSDAPAFPYTIVDLSAIYSGQLAQAKRGVAVLPSRQILIQDEVTAKDTAADVRWAMNTLGEPTEMTSNSVVLVQGDKRLRFEILSPQDAVLETFSTEPPNEWDEPNPGTRQVGFHVHLEPGASQTLAVLLTPGSVTEPIRPEIQPMAAWK